MATENYTFTGSLSGSNLWNTQINSSLSDQTVDIPTSGKYLDRNIRLTIKGASSGTQAAFSNLQGITETASGSNVAITTTAGYAPLNYATGITIPSGTSSSYKTWSTTAGDYNVLNLYNTNSNVSTYFGKNGETYSGNVYIGNLTSSTDANKTVGTVSKIQLLGYSDSTSKCDTITTLNIGTSSTHKGAQVATINNYGKIGILNLSGGYVNYLHGTGYVITQAGYTLNTYYLANYSGTKGGGTLTTLSLGAGTASYRGGRINTLTMNAYSQIGTLTNGGTISTLNGTGIISTMSGDQTITNVSGTLRVSNNALNGTVTINAYDNASTPVLTGIKTIVDSGKWVQKTVTPSTSTQGPYYGMVNVGAVEACTLSSQDNSLVGTNVTLSNINTGISVTGSGQCTVTKAGWIETGNIATSSSTKYITTITTPSTCSNFSMVNNGTGTWVDNYNDITICVGNNSTTTIGRDEWEFTFTTDDQGNITIH